MSENGISSVVETINSHIQKELWFDFEIIRYERNELVVGGGKSLSYPHELEIHFKGVVFVSAPVEWRTDTSRAVFLILEGDEASKVNTKFQVEQGCYIFKFVPEDYPEDFSCLIGASRLEVKFREQT
ncbi:hypothetical protein FE782_22365 [Paenibacillus antri]|uniref:Uncharacterized protein n=1 Tax=Paenibacillus antri TaxID=2582848 RepID=A0A5R9G7M1_9BACL|nr:hypothetical protein [Paenibacillus antri]TLS50080.1 hypothetical protein FE782_22365 [Paenibacillus antri]